MVNIVRKLIRPFIAVAFVLASIYLFIAGKIDPMQILQITGIIIGFYFGERSALKGIKKDD